MPNMDAISFPVTSRTGAAYRLAEELPASLKVHSRTKVSESDET
jgi:hypothetical protein